MFLQLILIKSTIIQKNFVPLPTNPKKEDYGNIHHYIERAYHQRQGPDELLAGAGRARQESHPCQEEQLRVLPGRHTRRQS